MQDLKLLIFAILGTVCAFYVDGVPVFNKYAPHRTPHNSPQLSSKGYFGYLSSSPATVSSSRSGSTKVEMKPEDGNSSPKSQGLIAGGVSALGAVGGGIASGVGGIVSGVADLGAESVTHLTNALSAVTPESLTNALGGIGDVTGALTNVITGQTNGLMNIETASVVLEKFGGLVPGLGPSVKAVKTVSHVIQKMKAIQNENGSVNPTKLMMEAVDTYFSDVDPKFKRKMIDLAPLAAQAAKGDTSAAMQIATSLADHNTVLEAMKGMGYKTQIDLVQNVVNQASNYAQTLKSAAGAAKALTGVLSG